MKKKEIMMRLIESLERENKSLRLENNRLERRLNSCELMQPSSFAGKDINKFFGRELKKGGLVSLAAEAMMDLEKVEKCTDKIFTNARKT